MKYATEKFLNKNNEIKSGVGENVLGKTTRKDYRRGTGNPRGY